MSCLHHSSVRLIPLLASLLTLVSLLLAPPAFAGYYQLTSQTGGLLTYKDATFPIFYSPSPYGYGAMGNANEWADCSGQITTTFEWQSSGTGDDPPKKVIIAERCSASWVGYGVSSPAFGVADNGLGSPEVPNGPVPIYDGSGNLQYWEGGGDASGTRYRIEAGQQTMTVTCSPQARTNGGSGGYAEVSLFYSANVYPVTVEWTGATPDGGALKVLTGQQATATLTIGSNTVSTPPSPGVKSGTDGKPMADWTITGTVFKNYDPTNLNKEQYVALKTEDKQKTESVSLYTKKDKDPINATCNATLDFPAGAILEDGLPLVTVASKELTSIKPTLVDGKIKSGRVDKITSNFGYFGYGQSTEGQYWYDVNISVPAPFDKEMGIDKGIGGFAQIITPHRTATRQANPPYPADVPYPKNDIDGLDTDYPYSFNFTRGSWPLPELQARGWDSPSQSLEPHYDDGGGTRWVKMTAYDQFKTYIMFEPTSGTSPVWIPMAYYEWHWKATCEVLQGGWTLLFPEPGIGANHNWAVTNEHPVWTVKHTYLSTEDLLMPH